MVDGANPVCRFPPHPPPTIHYERCLMRTLVTGATGFVGPYLAEALLAAGDEVLGLSRRAVWPPPWAHLQDLVPLISCDLRSGMSLDDVLAHFRPQRLCHLAGYAQ